MSLMFLQDQMLDQWMRQATPQKLRDVLPRVFAKGSQAQFQALIDCVLTEAKRREKTQNGIAR